LSSTLIGTSFLIDAFLYLFDACLLAQAAASVKKATVCRFGRQLASGSPLSG
jgi:hypothetical protein